MSFPASPVNGQTYTAPSGVVYTYDSNNTAWNISGATSSGVSFTVAATAPTGMSPGAMWFEPTGRVLSIYVYDGSAYSWVTVS